MQSPGRGPALAFAIAAASAACSPTYFDEDEVRAGVMVDWGPQRDREGLEELLVNCQKSVNMAFTPGAAVKFVEDPNAHCGIPAATPVAGCWIPQHDLVVLTPSPTLRETALCHELLHRQLFARDRDPDRRHHLQEWSLLSAFLRSLDEAP
ncbi:MAG TPA: hypothetical protein VN033_12100 [Vulgatibacter sp.]|nr:hypothetical protein [Vulgatibacter sp.]